MESFRAASALRSIESSSQLISFGSIVASGNAVMRLEVDEVELISGDWNRTGFTIPVCGALTITTCTPLYSFL